VGDDGHPAPGHTVPGGLPYVAHMTLTR